MELSSYFGDFLPRISQTERQKQLIIEEHTKLREALMKYPTLKPVLLSTFIQGSQRRFTAIKGSSDHPCDVDVVAVTNLPRNSYTAEYAHSIFEPFLRAHYPGRYKSQDRSWCITVDHEVTMDLVPTSEPDSKALREAVISRKFDWSLDTPRGAKTGAFLQDLSESILEAAQRDRDWDKEEPLWIPDRSVKKWEKTHPLYLIAWTAKKNLACNGHFTHVVKVLKWWRRHMEPLYLFAAQGQRYPAAQFHEQIKPFLTKDRQEWEGKDFAWEGIGCWHPVFPATGEQITMFAAAAVAELDVLCSSPAAVDRLVVFERGAPGTGTAGLQRVKVDG